MKEFDLIVIGSGIAGLSFALKVAEAFPLKKIVIVTKSSAGESNTRYAQGGIAVVNDLVNDSFEKHIQDTLTAGDGLCDKSIVEMVVKSAPECIQELVNLGVHFDKDKAGHFTSSLEGGHTENRVVHVKDHTGFSIEKSLLEQLKMHPNIQFFKHHFITEILIDNGKCIGVETLHRKKKECFFAPVVMIASGGIGKVYPYSTNPQIATGDGIAMAWRAGAMIENMEFIQFHPTAMYHENNSQLFLISETLRGEGAILRNHKLEAFMEHYHPMKDLAPRDVVSRAMFLEMQKSGMPYLYLDSTMIPQSVLQAKFPTIWKHCIELQLNISKEMIPVCPAAHYICGGIKTDRDGNTTIQGLYAVGECASTGLHGANRLASNSLLEAVVFAHRAAESVKNVFGNSSLIRFKLKKSATKLSKKSKDEISLQEIQNLQNQIQNITGHYAGIIKFNDELAKGLDIINSLIQEIEKHIPHAKSVEFYEAYNMAIISKLIIQASLTRHENRGTFFKTASRKLEQVPVID
jgi:L-aspartate oxidase